MAIFKKKKKNDIQETQIISIEILKMKEDTNKLFTIEAVLPLFTIDGVADSHIQNYLKHIKEIETTDKVTPFLGGFVSKKAKHFQGFYEQNIQPSAGTNLKQIDTIIIKELKKGKILVVGGDSYFHIKDGVVKLTC